MLRVSLHTRGLTRLFHPPRRVRHPFRVKATDVRQSFQLRPYPCRSVHKPSQRRERVVRPLPPERVELIREDLLARRRPRNAVLISVLAYGSLRPGEALALVWGDIRERTILVERAVAEFETLLRTRAIPRTGKRVR